MGCHSGGGMPPRASESFEVFSRAKKYRDFCADNTGASHAPQPPAGAGLAQGGERNSKTGFLQEQKNSEDLHEFCCILFCLHGISHGRHAYIACPA